MSKQDDLKATLLEILLDPASTEVEKRQAQAGLRKLSGTPTEPEIKGNVTLPDGPVHTRDDGSTYRSKSLTVSAAYAKELQQKHGTLSGAATEQAAGERLVAAVYLSHEPDQDEAIAKLLLKWPDSEDFFRDTIAKTTAFWRDLGQQIAKLRTKEEPPVESIPEAC